METIKATMKAMKLDKENAEDRADQLIQQLTTHKRVYDKNEEEIDRLQKRINQLISDVEFAQSQLNDTTTKLEQAQQLLVNKQLDVESLMKIVRTKDSQFDEKEQNLQTTVEKLKTATHRSDDIDRSCNVLSSRQLTELERIAQLEREVRLTMLAGEESERKYEERGDGKQSDVWLIQQQKTAEQLSNTEVHLERGEARMEAAEAKVQELDEELKIVGNIVKSLVISQQEMLQREESYDLQIRQLTDALEKAEIRSTAATELQVKLYKDIEKLEDSLFAASDKFRAVNLDIDLTFAELSGY